MTDFSLPVNTTLVANVLGILRDRDTSIAKMDFTGDTNLAAGFLRYNRTNRVFEEWSGTAWVEMRVEPAGIIKAFGGGTAPRGHLLCDGAAVSRNTYAALFSAIGTTYGVGDNSTTFNLPDLRGRFPLGKATAGTGSGMGTTGGSLDHVHSVQSHFHGKGTLNITSSGGHTTTINLSHGHTVGSGTQAGKTSKEATGVVPRNGTTDNITGSVNITLTDPGHGHGMSIPAKRTAPNTAALTHVSTYVSAGAANEALTTGSIFGNTTNITLNNGNHSHSVNLVDPTHDHPVAVNDFSGDRTDTTLNNSVANPERGKHTHASSEFAGLVGETASGRDGDAGFNTLGANPPFQVVNYIISF